MQPSLHFRYETLPVLPQPEPIPIVCSSVALLNAVPRLFGSCAPAFLSAANRQAMTHSFRNASSGFTFVALRAGR
jgi:hypothetical protein